MFFFGGLYLKGLVAQFPVNNQSFVTVKDGSVKKITEGKFFPNGLAFTPNGQQLILAETYRHRLWLGDWNTETATWTNARVWAAVDGPTGPGGPDGMAFGQDGLLYVAVYGTGTLQVIDPGGQLIDKLTLPGPNPTNCAFDPEGQLGLVVTEAGNEWSTAGYYPKNQSIHLSYQSPTQFSPN